MVEYKCERCLKIFKQKTDYLRHQKRKFSCKNENKTLDSIEETAKNESQKNTKNHKKTQKITEKKQNIGVDDEVEGNGSKKVCNYCKKVFSRQDSLSRHITKHCKVKKSQDNEKESLLQKLLEEMRKQNKKMEEQNKKMFWNYSMKEMDRKRF
jgi:uncharacterized C2H2 Zn-finger protein